MKIQLKHGSPIGFVEFTDEQASTNALQLFQGYHIGDVALKIDYAKAKMGETKRRGRENDEDERPSKRQNTGNSNDPAPTPISEYNPPEQ